MNEEFKQYRLQKGYSLKTIQTQNSYVKRFGLWMIGKQLNMEELNSQNILECLAWFRGKNSHGTPLHNCLQAIRIYLNYQLEKGIIEVNPALPVKLRSVAGKPKPQPLSSKNMEEIYQWFTSLEAKNERERIVYKRDTVVLGLLFFQGLDSGDLERLTVQDIDLHRGTVYVASSRRNAARKLKLESIQILPVQEYLLTIRTKVRFCRIETDKLFPQSKIQDIVSRLAERLKKQYPDIENPRHIHSSVIMNWLRTNHIRQVQYMAGHRHISSTEKYQKEDLHDLAQQLSKYHPMK